MPIPPLKLTNKINGEPTAWKCPACHEPFDLAPFKGTTAEKRVQMEAAYAKHFKDTHSHEDASQAAGLSEPSPSPHKPLRSTESRVPFVICLQRVLLPTLRIAAV
jgi:hypothetical protein